MCDKAVGLNPWQLEYVPNHFKIQERCNTADDDCPWKLSDVPDHLKTREMCSESVRMYPYLLEHFLDWFITQQVGPWHNDELIKWYEGYKKRKAQKAKIKEELLSIAWYPSRWRDWCMPEDEKKSKIVEVT